MTNKKLLIYVQNLLNDISIDMEFDIQFKGYNDYVDVEWRRKMVGVNYTPFSLIANNYQELQVGTVIDFRYSLYIMPFEDDRQKIEYIMEEFDKRIQIPFIVEDEISLKPTWNVVVKPVNLTYGGSFSEGSGRGILRFETLYTFNGVATSNYNMLKDLVIEVGGNPIPVNSYKWEHGKVSYVNKGDNFVSENSKNLNNGSIVIECPISKQNTIVQDFIVANEVNVVKGLKIMVGDLVILDEEYNYDGFSFAGNQNNQSMNIYLYFTPKRITNTITINGDSIPILAYGVATKMETLAHDNIDSNLYKNLFTGKVTSFAFSVSEDEDDEYTVLDTLNEDLIEGEDRLPIYQVEISINNKTYNKTLVLTDITKESEGTTKGVLKLTFLESGELDG